MRQGWKNGYPAFLAILILFIVEIVDISGIASHQQDNFEKMANIVMLMVAIVGFFCQGLPSLEKDRRSLSVFLSNTAVSAIAFFMNIDVFKHTIRLDQLAKDIWCCHMIWVISILAQILFLSGLWTYLFCKSKILVIKVKEVSVCVKSGFSSFVEGIKDSNKSVLLTMAVGIFIWIISLMIQIEDRGAAAVFSDTDFWWKSVWMWLAIIVIGSLFHMASLIFQETKNAIQNLGSRKVLAVVAVIAFTALANVLPSLLQTIAIIVAVPVVLMGLLFLIIRKFYYICGVTGKENSVARDMNLKWIAVVLFSFVGLPLAVICLATCLWADGREIIMQGSADITTWLNFINSAAEVAKSLLDLLL